MDKKHFEAILNSLRTYDKIHAVVVLLKPNNPRLSVAFKFCILELLRHLHKSLESNIIFAFTNSRGTFYQPGDNLKIDVSPSNYFCFDNEAFRYLSFQYLNFILENTDFLNSLIYLFLIPFHTPDPK